MALGKVQQQIVAKLEEMNRLSAEQQGTILATPGDLTGDALDQLLQDEYRITDFQLLVARARALGLAPYNVQRYQIGPKTFEYVPQDFCQENLVLPVGQVGDFLLVAFANPFEVTLAAKIQEMTGKRVVRLLAREKDIKEKFNKNQQVEVRFTDVVQQIGAEYAATEDIADEDRQRGVRPDHPLGEPDHRGRIFRGGERHPRRAPGEGGDRAVPDRRHLPGEAPPARQGRPALSSPA